MSNMPPPPLSGPFTLEDVADGVPGAAEGLASQATAEAIAQPPTQTNHCPACDGSGTVAVRLNILLCDSCGGTGCLHHSSQKKNYHCALCEQDDNCLRCKVIKSEQTTPHDTASAWDDSLDTDDPQMERVVTKTMAAITMALPALSEVQRLLLRGAMQEVYQSVPHPVEQQFPDMAMVKIPGIPWIGPRGPNGFDHWQAFLIHPDDGRGERDFPCYQIDGDPNSVAVGRFKASLRKFLGIS